LHKLSNSIVVCTVAVTVGLAVSCASTQKTRSVKTVGFLDDYAQLQEGAGEQAQRVYINPGAQWSKYNRIWIEPMAVYASPKSDLEKLSSEDLNGLVNYLDAKLRQELKGDYRFTESAGENVMRLRVAITDADGGRPVLGVMSTVMPIGLAVSAVKKVATGTHSAVGSARIEMEILDSVSGERLAAAVDERAGAKWDLVGAFSKWDDVRDAFDYWAGRLKTRLAELRGGAGSS
jgi:hypothetical protein